MRSTIMATLLPTMMFMLASTSAFGDKLGTKHVLALNAAKQIAAAAEAEARKNNWNVVIALVDDGGHLIYLQRLDDTQTGSVEIAIKKAQTAAAFRRPSKVFEDAVGNRLGVITLGVIALEGGLPLVVDGKVIGAIGVSGVTSQQDGIIAKAGADALGKIAES